MIGFTDTQRSESLRHKVGCVVVCISLASTLLTGCLPEPKLDYPTPSLDFAQEVTEVVTRSDAEPPPSIDIISSTMDMSLGGDLDMGLDAEIGDMDVNPADLGTPVLRTQSLHFIGDPTQRTSLEDLTLYGHFGLGHLLQERSAE